MTVVRIKATSSKRVHASIEQNSFQQNVALCGGIAAHVTLPTEEAINCPRCLKALAELETQNTNPTSQTEAEEPIVTTTVAKGANRPAAAARRAKAAQRTPLPAKGATQGHGKETTAKVIRDEVAKAKSTAPKAERPGPHAKASALVEYANKAGWTAAAEKGETATDLVTFKAVREGETVTLHWIEGGTRPGTHTNGGRQVQAMNAATVRRILDTAPEAAAQVRTAYASGSGRAKRAAVRVATAAPLPFDLDTATPEEIVAAVTNRTVTWTNGISGSTETAVVTGKGKNAPKVTGEGNARALTFWAKGEGSRSLRLLSLVSVS